MPLVNGKFYVNPVYGRTLERSRAAEEGRPWSEHNPEFEYVAAVDPHDGAQRNHPAAKRGGHGRDRHRNGYNAATTISGAANQIYNETSGLRTTNRKDNGPGSDVDMQEARNAMAHVIRNRAKSGIRGGLGSDSLTPQARQAIGQYASPAHDAHGESLFETHRAAAQRDPTGGATHFYLDNPHKQRPDWAESPIATYGPFTNVAGGGDVPVGDPVRILIIR